MDIKRPSIEIISHTPDAEKLIEECGRESYGSPPSEDYEGTRKWIQARLRGWELDVLEHASVTFLVVCSRVTSQQITRHRIAAYTQQSQRFRESKIDDVYLIPPQIKDEDIEEWIADYVAAFSLYTKWRNRGYHKQTARYHLPGGTGTRIRCTWNFRMIRHIIEMRAEPKADPEFRFLARNLLNMCVEKWPAVFEDLQLENKS